MRLDARRRALGKTDCDAGVDLEVGVLGGVSDERVEGVADRVLPRIGEALGGLASDACGPDDTS